MTRYWVRYQPKNGRPENVADFGSASERALFLISYALYLDVRKLWEASDAETHYMPLSDENDMQDIQTALCGARVPWRENSALPTCQTCERLLSAQIAAVIDDSLGVPS